MKDEGKQKLLYFSDCFVLLVFREIHGFKLGNRDSTGIFFETYFSFWSFYGESIDFIWETEILVFIFLFLRWIMGYVTIENRSFCSRGRGP